MINQVVLVGRNKEGNGELDGCSNVFEADKVITQDYGTTIESISNPTT